MFEDTEIETLIRAVWSLGCSLLVEELGFDSTVHILTDLKTKKLVGSTKYPSTAVSSCGDPHQWYTIGPLCLSKPRRTVMSQSMLVRRNMVDQGHAF
jgi:hypothetical protein